MATRVYLQNAAAISAPATARGAWNESGGATALKLFRERAGAIGETLVAETSATDAWDVMVLKLVSEPILAQTVAGTLDWLVGVRESDLAMNAHWHMHAYVEVGVTDAVRGTLYTDYTEAAGTNEWAVDPGAGEYTASGPTDPLTLTAVVASDNDRIVIELGYVARNTDITSYTGALRFGGTSGIELVSGNANLLTGWFSFSQDLFPPVKRAHRPHRSNTNNTADTLSFLGEEYTEWT